MITYEVSKADLEYVQKKLEKLGPEGRKAFAKAINYTAKDAVRRLASGAQSAYTVKIGGFASRMPIRPRATPSHLEATITAKDRPLTVPRFSHRGNTKGKGGAAASADIVKGGLKEIIRSSGEKAFKVNGLVMQRTGKSRTPVRVLRSNSVPKMIEKVYKGDRGVDRQIRDTINQKLHDHIRQELERLI